MKARRGCVFRREKPPYVPSLTMEVASYPRCLSRRGTPPACRNSAPGDGVDTFGTAYLDRMVRRCGDWLDREGDSEFAHKIRSCIKQRTTEAHLRNSEHP